MTTFTDEDKELIKEIRERIGSLDVRDNIERRAYEIALASLEAGVVAWRYRYVKKTLRTLRVKRGLVTGNTYRQKKTATTGRTMKFRNSTTYHLQ